jgi:hypothetical protein
MDVLDLTPARDTVRIGIVYVGSGQSTELEIFGNLSGSVAYERFLRAIGHMVPLQGCTLYTAGLDRSNTLLDGEFALIYTDQLREVCFQVSTLLPNNPRHKTYLNKKRHIANNPVLIAFTEVYALLFLFCVAPPIADILA